MCSSKLWTVSRNHWSKRRNSGGVGYWKLNMLFNLAQTLGSLTTSPIKAAVDQAHRMAQRRLLEAGGAALSARGRVGDGASRHAARVPITATPPRRVRSVTATCPKRLSTTSSNSVTCGRPTARIAIRCCSRCTAGSSPRDGFCARSGSEFAELDLASVVRLAEQVKDVVR